MDHKAQSALEYLMTYGWALIVIAIVIGVLIFVTSSATGGVTCQSQSSGVIVTEQSVTQSTVGLTLRNATGGDINAQDIYVDGTVFTSAVGAKVNGATPSGVIVTKNTTFTVTGVTGTGTAGSFQNGKVIVSYKTAGGLDANGVIACAGTV